LEELEMPATRASLAPLRAFVLARAEELAPAVAVKIDLVLEELLLNIFDYAYEPDSPGTVAVACAPGADGGFVLRIRDRGRPFDPLARPAPDLDRDLARREVGGLGILLVREMSRSQTYRHEQGANVLEIVFGPSPD
jgi:anti-sigma regulatory factor (Ser/Thr protein kinase)